MSRLDDRSNMVPLRAGAIIRETQKAYLIKWTDEDHGDIEAWFPISKVFPNKLQIPCVPQWLYDSKIDDHIKKIH